MYKLYKFNPANLSSTLLISFLCLLLSSCSQNLNLSDKQLVAIRAEADKLLVNSTSRVIAVESLQMTAIAQLTPERIQITDGGLIIVLDTFFVEESGLFISRKGVEVDISKGKDPSYKKIGNGIYKYIVKG